MVALLLPRSYSELSERRDWFALRKRLLLLTKSGRGAPDTDTEPLSNLKTENELRKSRKPMESCQFLLNDIFVFHVSELEVLPLTKMVSLSCSEVPIATGRKRTQSCVRFLCKETGDGGGGTVIEENSAVDLLDMIKERCHSSSNWCPVGYKVLISLLPFAQL